jgi:hypothetical protein
MVILESSTRGQSFDFELHGLQKVRSFGSSILANGSRNGFSTDFVA